VPPVGVYIISGCGPDLFINICLTLLGYLPGHIHAFWLIYVFYVRQEKSRRGQLPADRAPFVFSDNIQAGGTKGYGTVSTETAQTEPRH
jgi:uncharacterized membrane protein YqaE (UPF0057 family)